MNIRTIKQEDGSLVYPITGNTFDYFTGDGWETWSRYRIVKGHVIHLGGVKHPIKRITSLKT